MTTTAPTHHKTSGKGTGRRVTFPEFFFGFLKFLVFKFPLLLANAKTILGVDKPIKKSMGQYFEKNAKKYPDHPALIFEDRTWTFKAFNKEVNRLANFWISLGIKRGDVVTVFLANRPEMLFCMGAAAKIGAAASMINFNLRGKALHHCATIAPCKAYIVDESLLDEFEEIRPDLQADGKTALFLMTNTGEDPVPDGYQNLKKLIQASSTENPSTVADVLTSDPYAYVFTSGTTGMPKAAFQFHRSWIKTGHFMGKVLLGIKPKDRFYVCLPFFHTNSVKMGWSVAHANAATIVMARKFSTRRFWDDIRKYQVTMFSYIGELCTYLVNQPENGKDSHHSVRGMVGNGMRPDVYSTFKKRFKIKKIVETYGASEFDFSFFNAFGLDGTIGFTVLPFALARYDTKNDDFIRDENGFLQKTASGEPGILLCEAKKSVNVTGYTSSEATEKKMIQDAFEKGDRWFNTGDMIRNIGYGHHQFVDRMGDTFRWKGENVSTMEVEKIVNSFAQVEQSTAYGVKFQDQDGRLGMVTLIPATKPEEFDLAGFGRLLVNALPAYAAPRFLRLTAEFESTQTFKIKKNPLRDQGFDITKINDPIFVILPGDEVYQPLTPELYSDINSGDYRF